MADEIFEPYWEIEGQDLFRKIDIRKVDTPCYVLHNGALEKNLKKLSLVKKRTDCKILLALKGFSMWSTFPLIKKHLDGVCASSVNEARLGFEEFSKEVHSFAPAYSEEEMKELLKYSNHIVFNSFSQWKKYKSIAKKRKIECGIRVNPECLGGAEVDLYNPCAPNSRMGVTLANFDEDELEGIDGLHFHVLCEQGADSLKKALELFEQKFGKYVHKMKWVNFGGGHHITRDDYDIDLLCKLVNDFKKKYNVQVYLEPGEAVALNAGVLISSVLDIVDNGMKIAILDTSAEAHMPDTLAMPYRPSIIYAAKPGEKKYTYRLGGNTCLSGDIIGDYSFDRPLKAGDKLVFLNMAIYTMVKNTMFNGVRLPAIAIYDSKKNKTRIIRKFEYKDYKGRLS
jgi:carboxynorspermidine decarboxylase